MSFEKELFTNALAFIKFLEDGKEYFGEVFVTDNSNRLWKIKVRYDNSRKIYLKFELKAGGKQKFRASADNYKPSKYVRITPEQWRVFFELTKDGHNTELKNNAQIILNSLICNQPNNTYISKGGLDWAWASPISAEATWWGTQAKLDLSYQQQFGWRLPTLQEIQSAPVSADFFFSGANVPFRGTDPIV